jgi:chromosome partitioning protein
LSSSVKIRESHQQAKPVIYLDPAHKIAREFLALHQELSGA